MAVIKPFKAIRPTPELVRKVAALPYDVMSSDEARATAEGNPYTFLHVDKAEIDLDSSVNLYDQRVYEQARENLRQMIADGVFVREREACLYIYRQTMAGRPQTGLVVCASIDDYLSGAIKKHELTRADKELDRMKHVDYCDANTGPIFLTYRAQAEINARIGAWTQAHSPVYDFISDDGIGHTVWVIDDPALIASLTADFAKIDALYIADGHHRSASAVKIGLKRREQFPDYDGSEEFNFFLSVLFPDEQLFVMDYNRVVRDLNGHTLAEYMNQVREKFIVEEVQGKEPFKPSEKHTFGMYIHAKWYKLTAKAGSFDAHDPVARLDVSIIQNQLLGPILGIQDPRKDKRIDFIGGIRGLTELERRVTGGMKVAFSMYPTTIDDLMAIADAGEIMPPKSTWFEPKLRSGIFVHELK
ncbi:MAG: DUF1015 family protein [Peptococcaceae bacterium]|jgi:uncharacterized protein (DUF1015 family)|nr:DUF1015 family protein [Peptococcaceae bacterium]